MGKTVLKSSRKTRPKQKKHKNGHRANVCNMKKMANVSDKDNCINNLPAPTTPDRPTFKKKSDKILISADLEQEELLVDNTSLSLQEAFLKFREKRQNEFSALKTEDTDLVQRDSDKMKMENLRTKFLEKCKTYIGVPYKKKYHKPGTPEYQSKLFLDCCGLVRRVLRDLHKDFGFRIGPWNQGYMYDTLPVEVTEEEMRPGDLVFISVRKQAHNMVHVEVWLGDGPKTLGARWHKGRVQIFDSYQFVSTSYHSMTYHFRSIDTWLQGICKSFCQVHPWKRPKQRSPSKKSVFYRAHSPVTIENQSNAEENLGDIVDIDASEEESDDSSASNSVRKRVCKVDKLNPCEEKSIEQEAEDLCCDSNLTIDQHQLCSIGSQTCNVPAAIKYVSFSKSLSSSLKEIQTESKKPKCASSRSRRAQSLSPNNPSTGTLRPGSKPVYIFTNKPVTDEMVDSLAANVDVRGNKIATNQYKNYPRLSSSTSLNQYHHDHFEHLKIAHKLVTDVIERALSEFRASSEVANTSF